MKVIAGKYGGRNLKSSKNARPTLARIKKSVFSIISEYIHPEAQVLDLFAGSGALGIECISRGVKSVDFVDSDKDALKIMQQNLRDIDFRSYKILISEYSDALRTFSKQGKRFDIIFIDPPYDTKLGEIALDMIFRLNLLSDDGIVVLELSSNKVLQDLPKGSIIIKQRSYGAATIYFIKGLK